LHRLRIHYPLGVHDFCHLYKMKKKSSWLFLGLLVLGFASCRKVEAPTFQRLNDFKIKKLGLQKADIGFSVTYFNPNNFGVAVKEAAIDVYIDSLYIGKFVQESDVSVDKKADFTVPLTGSIPVAKALQLNVEDFLNKEVGVKALGNVKVGKAGVFITRDFNYQGKHRLNIKL
jgi:LEA14-like dessication related protein